MMSNKTLCSLIIVFISPAIVHSLSVIGPRVLRPHSSYRVAVTGDALTHSLYVAVEGTRANGESYSKSSEVPVQEANSRIVNIEIADPGPGQYYLVARSTSRRSFSSSAPLIYQPRSYCVLVQTDKRVYQPGDTISFRVIALDKYLLPLSDTVEVSVLDAGGSPVREWLAAPLDRGVISYDLLLADEPALGEWTIQVRTRGQTYSRQIRVADYIMPKFQMDLQMPKEILFSEGRFNINITAKHFNGLPVRGVLTVSAYPVFFSGILQPIMSSPVRKVIDFDGHADVVYDLKTDLDLAEDAARPLVVEAVLEEKDTLVKQNVSSKILLLRTPYRLKVTAPEYFKPALPYNVQIEVLDTHGNIINTNEEVTVERFWDDGAPPNTTTLTLRRGLATYTITPNDSHIRNTLNLVVKYKEATEPIFNVVSSGSTSKQFLTIELLSTNTSLGDEMRARISATEPMDLVNYIIIGRGDILYAKTVELKPARKSVDISALVTVGMTPGCVILAWYPRLDLSNNSMISAAVYAPHKNLLQNRVSISSKSTTTQVYRPNSMVDLQVSGEPGSLVALLGEDASVISAGLAGHDGLGSGLDMHTVEREVESFSGLKHSIFKNEEHLPILGLDLGGYNATHVFTNAGVVILTDVENFQSDAKDDSDSLPETGTRAPLAGPYAFTRLPPPPSPRYYLTVAPQPTWMLTNFTLDNEGKGTSERWTPATSGELAIGAFSIHPTLGLGLASPHSFLTTVPLTIDAALPATLQRGETLAAVITLKSTLTVDISLEVTFHNTNEYFEFEPLDNSIDTPKKIELYRRLRVSVPAQGSASTAFLITAARTGEASVIVEASGNGVSESLFRTIRIEDGYEEEWWSWGLLDARRGIARDNVTLEPTAGTRLGPVTLLAAGDLLAGAMQVARGTAPAGDPTHALRPLAVSCVLLDYLQAIGKDEKAISKEAMMQAISGFQRLMAYRRADGSFSMDTDDDAEGDVWMTSEAARWLSRCGRYVPVSPAAGVAAARWLEKAQHPDGSWPSPPPSKRADQHAQAPLPITAHAILALWQTKDRAYKNAINRGLTFLSAGMGPTLDAYTLAVVGSVLAVTNQPQAVQVLEMMHQYANVTGSTLFWSRKIYGSEWRNPWLKGNSFEASTAAWGLRGLLNSRLVDKAAPVAKYLLHAAYEPHNQDPDVLDALAQYAEIIKTTSKLRVSLNVSGTEEPRQFSIADDNAFIVQTQLIRNSRSASAVTEGRGVAIVGLSAKGSTNVTAAWPRYTLDPRVDQVSTKSRLQLSICVGFVGQGNETESGLTLLTVQLPSGYLADINTLTELTSARHVYRARLQRGGARVLAWLYADRAERCATLAAPLVLPVAAQRPGWATLLNLYDSSQRARVFFQAIPRTACDVCREWVSCQAACGTSSRQRAPDTAPPAPDHAHKTNLASVPLILALILVILSN